MTAGRGIIHSEMPRQQDGLMWGFQLWVNLPAKDKMMAPRYQEFPPVQIPVVHRADGTTVRVVAGESEGVSGAVVGIATQPLYLDVAVPAGQSYEQATPTGHTGLVYVFEGEAEVGASATGAGTRVAASQLAVLTDGEALRVVARATGVRFLLLAAQPLHEPVVRYGPFVMNTRAEIDQAIRDFQSGALGR
jgi:redox-sensitive bicupin YhaK (pirin superfamily)